MEIKFDAIDFPIEIPTKDIDKRKLTIKQETVDGDMIFRINMGDYTLARVYNNGDIVLHVGDYPGRDYKYESASSQLPGEVRYKLVPSKQEEK